MAKDQTANDNEGVRLQKVLAQAGIASRRASEELINDARVEVNGKIVLEQGTRVDPQRDVIRVDGQRVPTARHHQYWVLNKPRGVVSTMEDPEGRPDLTEYLPNRERLFHVGRLDTDTEGLLLLTNDGEFAHRMSHPSYQVSKTYLAQIVGELDRKTEDRLRKGIRLEDGPVRPDKLSVSQTGQDKTMVTVVIHEGRNRVIRRMFEAVGYPVRRLARTAIGPVKLGNLPVGQSRELRADELGSLLDLVKM